MKEETLNGKAYKVQIWDSDVHVEFKSIIRNYYRGAQGILLVYDITQQESFDSVHEWMNELKTYAIDSISVVLLGNKNDLESKRVISTEAGKQLAGEFKIPFFETSAVTNTNVNEAFRTLLELCYAVQLDQKKHNKTTNENGCCFCWCFTRRAHFNDHADVVIL